MTTGYASFADAPRIRHREPSAVAHTLTALFAWAVAGFVTLLVASESKIGPVVLTVTRTHGLHAGDVAAFLVMSFLATLVTIAVAVSYWSARRRARRAYRY